MFWSGPSNVQKSVQESVQKNVVFGILYWISFFFRFPFPFDLTYLKIEVNVCKSLKKFVNLQKMFEI